MKKTLLLANFLFICTFLGAQNLSGFWKGTLNMPSACFPVNNIELQITVKGDSVFGNSYHYLDVHYYVKKKFTGTYFPSAKKIILNEGIVTTFKIPDHCKVCIKNYILTYSRKGDQEFLTGTWDGKIQGSNQSCDTNTIKLSRVRESAFKEIPEIEVDTGDLRLDFYDNAQVDGDSITVLVNKKVVLTHQRLTTKPITTYVRIDERNPFQEVEMVAENLGSIPPNTAMLIVTAGENRYRLFLTSRENKSAAVRFIYVPPKEQRVLSP